MSSWIKHEAKFLMNRVDWSDLSDKPFPIVTSRSALFCPAAYHDYLILDVVIQTPV